MFDYEAMAALAHVIDTQNFQKAADKLFITQSAISQRIKSLETYYGEPVLIRTTPYRATDLGLILLGHYERVRLLESSVLEELNHSAMQHPFSLAISRDSLATWFMPVMNYLHTISPSLLYKIVADDQEVTLNYLKNGLVSACASSMSDPLPGCKTDFLGYFDYVLVATPEFSSTYFSGIEPETAFAGAATIVFDHQDNLHCQYVEKYFHLKDIEFQCHMIPSVTGFKQFVCNGFAYALIPKLDVTDELEQGTLIQIFPDKVWEMPVYWHTWAIETPQYKLINETIRNVARGLLRQ